MQIFLRQVLLLKNPDQNVPGVSGVMIKERAGILVAGGHLIKYPPDYLLFIIYDLYIVA